MFSALDVSLVPLLQLSLGFFQITNPDSNIISTQVGVGSRTYPTSNSAQTPFKPPPTVAYCHRPRQFAFFCLWDIGPQAFEQHNSAQLGKAFQHIWLFIQLSSGQTRKVLDLDSEVVTLGECCLVHHHGFPKVKWEFPFPHVDPTHQTTPAARLNFIKPPQINHHTTTTQLDALDIGPSDRISPTPRPGPDGIPTHGARSHQQSMFEVRRRLLGQRGKGAPVSDRIPPGGRQRRLARDLHAGRVRRQ